MLWGKLYWPFFLILTSCLFLIPELIGLFTNPANTLSEYAWDELDVHGFQHIHTLAWWLSLCSWGLFVVIITLHIWWKRL